MQLFIVYLCNLCMYINMRSCHSSCLFIILSCNYNFCRPEAIINRVTVLFQMLILILTTYSLYLFCIQNSGSVSTKSYINLINKRDKFHSSF